MSGTVQAAVIHLPFAAAPVVLPRSVDEDLASRAAAIAQVSSEFDALTGNRYDAYLSAVEDGRATAVLDGLLDMLSRVNSPQEFVDLVDRQPGVLDDELLALLELVQREGPPSGATSLELIADLLREARSGAEQAWSQYQARLAARDADMTALKRAMEELPTLEAQGRWEEAILLARQALDEATAAGVLLAEPLLRSTLGRALLSLPGDRPENVNEAITQLQAASAVALPGELRADALVNLAAAYGRRVTDDPDDNLEASISALLNALGQLDEAKHAETCATAHTNLARAFVARETDSRTENLANARFHAEAAVRLRDPGTDAEAWAYSQSNLGNALDAQAREGLGKPEAVVEAFRSVIAESERIGRSALVANAHFAIAGVLGRRAGEHEEAGRDSECVSDLEAASAELDRALSLLDAETHPVLRGRVLSEAARVIGALGHGHEAIAMLQEAVNLLCPEASPRDGLHAAQQLGDMLSHYERWPEAADAYRAAVAARRVTLHARRSARGRHSDLGAAYGLARFASYAIAQSGDIAEALLVLEEGRATELRRRSGALDTELDALEDASAQLYRDYLAALSAVQGDPLAQDSELNSRRLSEVLDDIRALPGLQDFARRVRLEDIAPAVEPGWPLVYVSPAAYGTLVITATVGEGGRISLDAEFLEQAGQDLFLTLMGGDYQAVLESGFRPGSGPPAFLVAAAYPDRADIAGALDYLLPWLGARLVRPIAERLYSASARGVTLVPCGPVALAPLHAATWSDGGEEACLLDCVAVRYAASALLNATCATRAAHQRHQGTRRLVALANPENNLDAAEPEVEEIERTFKAGHTETRSRLEANVAFLAAEAPNASHLHLACHAVGDPLDPFSSVLCLADRELPLSEFAAIGPLISRLVALSACQTGLPAIGEFSEEVFSIGTAAISAGSACAIASQWSVDDASAALLMTRLYEELANDDDLRPPEALRRAALWLRDLTEEDEKRFLADHPALEAALGDPGYRRRRRHRRTPVDVAPSEDARPYSHPDFWAPFTALGV